MDSSDEIETIDSFQLLPGWKHAEFSLDVFKDKEPEDIKEIMQTAGVPVENKDYLVMADLISDNKIVYQWIKKTEL